MPDFLHGVEVITLDDGPRPIQTVRSAVIGVVGTAPDADSEEFPYNAPVLIQGGRRKAAKLDTEGDKKGTLPKALDGILDQTGALVVVIRVEEDEDEDTTRSNVIGGVDAATGDYTGVHALRAAQTDLGYTPRILCAPGHTHQRPEDGGDPAANPVVSEMQSVADKLRAVIIADGPGEGESAAIDYRDDWGSRRIFIVDPHVKVERDGDIVTEPASARVAGMIARQDSERGFWWSPSNTIMNGIVGTSKPVDFMLGDPNSKANLLNENDIATIIRENGFRLWGNRTTSEDSKWAFLNVVRTADMLNDSVLRNHLWAVDRNITSGFVDSVLEGVNAYMRELQGLGAILGGRAWADPEMNTKEVLQSGQLYIDFEFTPPAPAERISFRSRLTNEFFADVVE